MEMEAIQVQTYQSHHDENGNVVGFEFDILQTETMFMYFCGQHEPFPQQWASAFNCTVGADRDPTLIVCHQTGNNQH